MMRKLLLFLLFSCAAWGQGGTTSSDLFPVTTGQNLGSSAKRWNLYAQNLNITGVVTCTGSCNLNTSSSGSALLTTANTWTLAQTFSSGISGSGTTGSLTPGTGILTSTNVWTQTNTFPLLTFTRYTVATLPAAPTAGSLAAVSDGLNATDCTAGGGTTTASCVFGGVTWSALGAGSSSTPISGATTNALVTASSSTALQTPNASVLLDAATGNMTTPGTFTSGAGGSTAGYISLGQGTAQSTGTTAVILTAPTSVTSYNIVFPSAAATGFFKLSNAANIVTGSIASIVASEIPATYTTVSSGAIGALSSANGLAQIIVCSATCSMTPISPPAAGYQLCAIMRAGVTGTITLNALGNSALYPKTDSSGYGTAGTGTMVSTSTTGNKICIIGSDSTHYELGSYNGTFTSN